MEVLEMVFPLAPGLVSPARADCWITWNETSPQRLQARQAQAKRSSDYPALLVAATEGTRGHPEFALEGDGQVLRMREAAAACDFGHRE